MKFDNHATILIKNSIMLILSAESIHVYGGFNENSIGVLFSPSYLCEFRLLFG